jgi:uncharacterized membrane protein required for colicin V production
VILDILLLLVLAAATLNGWRSGAVAMVLSLAILAVAGLLASSFGPQVGEMLKIGPAFARPIVGFVLTFVALLLVGGMVKRAIRPKRGIIRGVDGLAGAGLGLVRGTFVLSVFLVLFRLAHLPPERTTSKSVIYPYVLKSSSVVIGVFKPYLSGQHLSQVDSV